MKTFKINIPEGYEIDKDESTFEKIVFKKIEKKLITSWEELHSIKGYYVKGDSSIIKKGSGHSQPTHLTNRNIYPTKDQALVAGRILPQLLQVRDYLRDGWEPVIGVENWRVTGKLDIVKGKNVEGFAVFIFTFPTEELAKHFVIYFGAQVQEFYSKLQ